MSSVFGVITIMLTYNFAKNAYKDKKYLKMTGIIILGIIIICFLAAMRAQLRK